MTFKNDLVADLLRTRKFKNLNTIFSRIFPCRRTIITYSLKYFAVRRTTVVVFLLNRLIQEKSLNLISFVIISSGCVLQFLDTICNPKRWEAEVFLCLHKVQLWPGVLLK